MKMHQAIIVSATMATLFCLWQDRPTPVIKSVQVDYCEIDVHVAVKKFGVLDDGSPALGPDGQQLWRWEYGWDQTYGPCSELDRYEDV